MAGVLIIGYGNPLRQDDGIGWLAAQRLEETGRGIETMCLHQLAPELAEPVSEVRAVIFVDASRELEAGEIEIRRLEPEATGSGGPMTHNMSPRLLLAAARLLYGRAPEAWQAAMGGGEWDMGENLSPRVEQAFPALLEKVRALALREASEGRAGG